MLRITTKKTKSKSAELPVSAQWRSGTELEKRARDDMYARGDEDGDRVCSSFRAYFSLPSWKDACLILSLTFSFFFSPFFF